MDEIELLRLEARTIWAERDGRLADDTVAATLLTRDGRYAVLAGSARLDADAPVTTTVCRSWVLESVGPSDPPTGGLRLITTAGPGTVAPPTGWSAPEWEQLLAGGQGPWAAVVDGPTAVSLAHCSRLTDEAVEAGVQTEPAFRGRRLAARVVRAWARQVETTGRTVFYSADEGNPASHRVAAQVGGRPIGRIVRVRLTDRAAGSQDTGAD